MLAFYLYLLTGWILLGSGFLAISKGMIGFGLILNLAAIFVWFIVFSIVREGHK